MIIYSAVDWNGGDPIPRRVYGIKGPTGALYAVSFEKDELERYVQLLGRTTNPKHWELVPLELSE